MPSMSFKFKPAAISLALGESSTAASTDDTDEKPVDQLKLVHAEVDRQRAAVTQRLASMHTRGAILVTASGVFSTVQANTWVSGWQFIGIGLSVIAAVFGLLAMRPTSGLDAFAGKSFEDRLWADTYSVEYSIVTDSITGLSNDMELVAKTANIVVIGYAILAVAWLAMPVMVALISSKII
ncbi:hypothetical protein ACSBOX_11580 [Arthrobacter sp. KN11-1C]|uniref:hypothetical protein n=1 Tax=Arthrobacter sp. KN11-1C TaxID=3445774 RepID=UPI003FA129FC